MLQLRGTGYQPNFSLFTCSVGAIQRYHSQPEVFSDGCWKGGIEPNQSPNPSQGLSLSLKTHISLKPNTPWERKETVYQKLAPLSQKGGGITLFHHNPTRPVANHLNTKRLQESIPNHCNKPTIPENMVRTLHNLLAYTTPQRTKHSRRQLFDIIYSVTAPKKSDLLGLEIRSFTARRTRTCGRDRPTQERERKELNNHTAKTFGGNLRNHPESIKLEKEKFTKLVNTKVHLWLNGHKILSQFHPKKLKQGQPNCQHYISWSIKHHIKKQKHKKKENLSQFCLFSLIIRGNRRGNGTRRSACFRAKLSSSMLQSTKSLQKQQRRRRRRRSNGTKWREGIGRRIEIGRVAERKGPAMEAAEM